VHQGRLSHQPASLPGVSNNTVGPSDQRARTQGGVDLSVPACAIYVSLEN
jgi:hypothetical protein